MAQPAADWKEEESNQRGFELKSKALAKRHGYLDIASQNLQREHEVLEAFHEMSRGEVRKTEHPVTYRIVRMEAHEGTERVNS